LLLLGRSATPRGSPAPGGSPTRSCCPSCHLDLETPYPLFRKKPSAIGRSSCRLVALMQQRQALPARYRGAIVRSDAFHFGPVGSLLVARVAQDHHGFRGPRPRRVNRWPPFYLRAGERGRRGQRVVCVRPTGENAAGQAVGGKGCTILVEHS
jgi:hypothetical protein